MNSKSTPIVRDALLCRKCTISLQVDRFVQDPIYTYCSSTQLAINTLVYEQPHTYGDIKNKCSQNCKCRGGGPNQRLQRSLLVFLQTSYFPYGRGCPTHVDIVSAQRLTCMQRHHVTRTHLHTAGGDQVMSFSFLSPSIKYRPCQNKN